MRQFIIGVVAGMLLPLFPAQASIQTDLNSDLSLNEIISNAITDGTSVEDILSELFNNCPDIDNPESVSCKSSTASAAASSFSEDAIALKTIGQTALDSGLTEAQLIEIALSNGIDPTAILPDTAAGNAPQNQNTGGGNTAPLSTFGDNTGSGGGGSASPSA